MMKRELKRIISVRSGIFLFTGLCCLMLCLVGWWPVGRNRVAAQAPPVIQLDQVPTGPLSAPVLVTSAHDGSNRLFIVEQTGRIKVLLPNATTATDFLNLSDKIAAGGERGLLGLAFHPKFSSNRRFFVNYTRSGDGATVIAEYKAAAADRNRAETAETVLLTVAQPFSNHNGGMIEFGPDGFLYIGMGDGGSANDPGNRAQNVNELLGKFLRINVDQSNGNVPYSSPATNPYFGATAGRDEIYATGLRNPWRWSFDRNTGQFYAGDVGQNQREWVHLINLGGNYGWPTWEGTRCNTERPSGAPSCTSLALVQPLAEYDHQQGRCSITGGYVYRGGRGVLPFGAYVYGDYCSGEIWMLNGGTTTRLLDTTYNISSFGEDEYGELYVVALGGAIYRISNPASPRAAISVSAAGYTVNTAASGICSAFGSNLATNIAAWTTGAQPTTLAGTTVKVRDAQGVERLAPLFYVSPTQVNYLMPDATAPGNSVVTITSSDNTISTGAAVVRQVAPALFTADASGSGAPAALLVRVLSDGTQRYEAITPQIDLGPPSDQVFLALFGTGIRGRSAPSAVTVTVGGESAEVTFAGAQPDYVGLDQVNAKLPRTLAGRGSVNVVVTVDGQATTNAYTVSIK
ncbi:MAG: PQQ-dependent sugar dehydrogenase [Blastocatellia bacterium]